MNIPDLINKAELARRLGMHRQTLNNKLKGVNGVFTDEDLAKTIEVLELVVKELKNKKA